MNIKERLLNFIEASGISIAEFERKCGLSNGYIRKLKGSVGSEKIEDIIRVYPQINKTWLLSGEGEMLNSSTQSVGDISNSNVSGVNVSGKEIHINPNAYETLLKIVEANQRTTEKFQEQIDKLIELLQKTI